MGKLTDWTALWRDLAGGQDRACRRSSRGSGDSQDPWSSKALGYDKMLDDLADAPDPLRDFMLSQMTPDTTVLDIGAGTGRWATLLARHCRYVTALDPSSSMLKLLRQKLEKEGVENVRVVQGAWPASEVEEHDITLCSHAMYSVPDLPAFIRRQMEVTRRTCVLILKSPTRFGLMGEACERVWGHPHDCPGFPIAYNILLDMGLLPNVLVDPTPWDPWTSPSLDEAFEELKRRLGLRGDTEHDAYLRELLARRLAWVDGRYVWPHGVRSVLVHWDVG